MPEDHRFSSLRALTRPVEFFDRMSGVLDQRLGRSPVPPEIVTTHTDHLAAAHEVLRMNDCVECLEVLPDVRREVMSRVTGMSHQDGGPALAETLWLLVRHLRPDRVVETGVARGISSAFTLDALARNEKGHLWSIDLPPLGGDWQKQVGIAVDPRLHERWTYIRAASSRALPPLLSKLKSIDIFSHDGLHTKKNQQFEYRTAWSHIRAGGALVSDDVHFSSAFGEFSTRVSHEPILIREPDKARVIGLLRKP